MEEGETVKRVKGKSMGRQDEWVLQVTRLGEKEDWGLGIGQLRGEEGRVMKVRKWKGVGRVSGMC